jgi:hypothetical protein
MTGHLGQEDDRLRTSDLGPGLCKGPHLDQVSGVPEDALRMAF